MNIFGKGEVFVKDAVDAHTHAQFPVCRVDMDIRGAHRMGILENMSNKLNNGKSASFLNFLSNGGFRWH